MQTVGVGEGAATGAVGVAAVVVAAVLVAICDEGVRSPPARACGGGTFPGGGDPAGRGGGGDPLGAGSTMNFCVACWPLAGSLAVTW